MDGTDEKLEAATFAAGCFWGVEETFRCTEGVVETEVGYTGGDFDNPTYEDVCADKTGHAEAVQVKFDPSVISYEDLLGIFWKAHDPTTLNRQGPDVGAQYRSAIFYHSDEQKRLAEKSRKELVETGEYAEGDIVTEIVSAGKWWPAEEYHQKYVMKKGGGSCAV